MFFNDCYKNHFNLSYLSILTKLVPNILSITLTSSHWWSAHLSNPREKWIEYYSRLSHEDVYNDFSLNSALQFTNSKIISLQVRSYMWKLIHRIQFTEIEEAKVKLIVHHAEVVEKKILTEFICIFIVKELMI